MGNTYRYSIVEKTVRSNRWVEVEDIGRDFGKEYNLWNWIHMNHDKVEFDYDNNMVVFSNDFVKETLRRLSAIHSLVIQHIDFYNEWGEPFFKDLEAAAAGNVLDYWMPNEEIYGDKYDMWYFDNMYYTYFILSNIDVEKLEDGVVQLALTWV